MKSNQNKLKWFIFLAIFLIACIIGATILVANHTFFADKFNDLEPEKKQQEIEKIETCINNTKISDNCILQIESDFNGIACTATVSFENSGSIKERREVNAVVKDDSDSLNGPNEPNKTGTYEYVLQEQVYYLVMDGELVELDKNSDMKKNVTFINRHIIDLVYSDAFKYGIKGRGTAEEKKVKEIMKYRKGGKTIYQVVFYSQEEETRTITIDSNNIVQEIEICWKRNNNNCKRKITIIFK